jgi:peptidoglycan/LPS O-acetylase OafA/YrhL
MKFRMEINALRAFSVLAVFLYHIKMPSTQLPLLSGGFLGVDVFFVISGYLISQVINDEILSRGKFDFGRFYLKRYRRIFPAFVVMLVLVTII